MSAVVAAGSAAQEFGARTVACPVSSRVTLTNRKTGADVSDRRMASYPLFLLVLDEFTFYCIRSPLELSDCEEPDVKDGLYEGWDSTGRHFRVIWNDLTHSPEAIPEEARSVREFAEAVRLYRARNHALGMAQPGCEPPTTHRQFLGEGYLESVLSRLERE